MNTYSTHNKKSTRAYYLGVDLGSTTIKCVLLTENAKVHHTLYARTKAVDNARLSCSGRCHKCGRCNLGALSTTVLDFLAEAGVTPEECRTTVVTGSQVVDGLERFIDYDAFVSEVTAHVAGARHYYPDCKAILDVGGQDSKAMMFDEKMGMWMSKMSGICAAGTGAFLDSVAAKLNIPVEEMAERVNYDCDIEVSSVCAVLSATSINKFKNRYPLSDVIAAACRAQARTVMSGVGEIFLHYKGDIVFQGGVASNRAVAYFLREITGNNIIIPEFHQVMGALGAACLAREYAALKESFNGKNAYAAHGRVRLSIPEFHTVVETLGNQHLTHEVGRLIDTLFVKTDKASQKKRLSIPEYKQIREALNDQGLKKEFTKILSAVTPFRFDDISSYKSIAMRTTLTRREFLSRNNAPLVWRNLFFPPEILNALGVRMLTLETYAALRGRSSKKLREFFDNAACKGFSAETCSFLRVLEGDTALPKPDYVVTTSEPCQQGERIFADLARDCRMQDNYYTLHTPIQHDDYAVEHIAAGLEESVRAMEKSLGLTLDKGELTRALELSNEARKYSIEAMNLRFENPPLMRGTDAILFATIFSQLWGREELVEMQKLWRDELQQHSETVKGRVAIEDTHRLLWLHLPPFYSRRLMDFVEITCGAPIIFEEVNFVGWEPLDTSDPYRSLARKLLTVGFLDPQTRVKHIVKYAHDARMTGIVLYNHMFGRCSMADTSFIKHLREELRNIGIPLLTLDGDCLDETIDPCSTTTKVSAFVEALNVKNFGNIFGKTA